MIFIFTFILAGVLVGYFTRTTTYIKHVSSIINIIIVFLLFFLGVAVGSNKQIIESFGNIGIDALAIASATTVGSVLCAWFIYNRFFRNKTS